MYPVSRHFARAGCATTKTKCSRPPRPRLYNSRVSDTSAKPCQRCANPRLSGRTLCRACYNAHRIALRQGNLDVINERRTTAERIKRAERHAQNRCKECGKPLAPADQARERCVSCRTANNAASSRRDRRDRLAVRGTRSAQGDAPYHVGQHVKANTVRIVAVELDAAAFTAAQTLKHRERERRRAECEAAGITDVATIANRTNLAFQTSRLLRYVIKSYNRDFNHLPHYPPSRPYPGKFVSNFQFGVDEHTLGIITHYAQERNGSLSRTVCDLICAACFPPATLDAPRLRQL